MIKLLQLSKRLQKLSPRSPPKITKPIPQHNLYESLFPRSCLLTIAGTTTLGTGFFCYNQGQLQCQKYKSSLKRHVLSKTAFINLQLPPEYLKSYTLAGLSIPIILYLGRLFAKKPLIFDPLRRSTSWITTTHRTILASVTHGGIFHLGFNIFLPFSVAFAWKTVAQTKFDETYGAVEETQLNLYLKKYWRVEILTTMFLGAIASTALCLARFRAVGLSGGVYAMLGYFYCNGQLDDKRMQLVFDMREEPFLFTLKDFVNYFVLPVEGGLSLLQLTKYSVSPLAHVGHVSGLLFGMLMYYCFMEGLEKGHAKRKFEQYKKELNTSATNN